jgi:twitching motility protein PilT
VTLHQLLKTMVDKGASYLPHHHRLAPAAALDGELVPYRVRRWGPVDTKQLCYSVLTDEQEGALRGRSGAGPGRSA